MTTQPKRYYFRFSKDVPPFQFGPLKIRGGEVLSSTDPCLILQLRDAADQASRRSGGNGVYTKDGGGETWEAVEAACKAQRQGGSGPPGPPPPPRRPVPAARPKPKPVLKKQERDSAAKQGAPQAQGPSAQVLGPPEPPKAGARPKDPPKRPAKGAPAPQAKEVPHSQPTDGDPVDLFSGRFVSEQTDFSLRSVGLPLDFARVYASGQSHFGPFGWGWDHIHNRHLRRLGSGDVAHWTGRLSEETYRGPGLDPPPGVFQVLERDPGVPDRYRMRAAGLLVTTFDRPPGWTDAERIPIARVEDRFGNHLTYRYDASDRLAALTDGDGNGLVFHYGGCGLLEAVEDHSGRRVLYRHAEDVEHLTEVQGPGAVRTRYTYGPSDVARPLRHAIHRIEDGEGNVFVQNRYDPATGRVAEQLFGDHRFQFRFEQIQAVPADRAFLNAEAAQTEVVTPDGALHVHTFNHRGDLLDTRTRLVADGSFRVVATQVLYDGEGNRTRIVHPDGMEERFVYDDAHPDPRMRGQLLRHEVHPRPGFPALARRLTQIAYEPRFQLPTQATDARGSVTRFVYDLDTAPAAATGRLERIELPDAVQPDGTVTQHSLAVTHDARGRLVRMVSPEGTETAYTYDAAGRLVRTVQDAGGLALAHGFAHDALGRMVRGTDPPGAVFDVAYDAQDRVIAHAQPEIAGARADMAASYDELGGVRRLTRPRGAYDDPVLAGRPIEDRIERDAMGHLAGITLAANTAAPAETAIRCNHRGQPVLTVDPEGVRTETCYDERGLALRTVRRAPDGSRVETTAAYDIAGRAIRSSSGGVTHRFEHDAFGRLAREVLPSGTIATRRYGPDDLVVEELVEGDDGAGRTVLLSRQTTEQDARGRSIRERVEVIGTGQFLTAETWWDGEDRPVAVGDQRGAVTRLAYDGLGRLTSVAGPTGDRIAWVWDAGDRLAEERTETTEHGQTVIRTARFVHDLRGRLTEAVAPGGAVTRHAYDDRDIRIATTGPAGREDRSAHGALGEVTEAVTDVHGLGIVQRFGHDRARRPLTYTDPEGMRTERLYDGLGRPVGTRVDGILRGATTYDADGRVAQTRTAGGSEIAYAYDAAGRLAALTPAAPGGLAPVAPHRFGYDGMDRLVRAESGNSVTQRRYDSLGRLLEDRTDGHWHRVGHDDATGEVTRTWPDGRAETSLTDPMGRVTAIRRSAAGTLGGSATAIARVTHAGGTVETSETLGAVRARIAYDAAGRPVTQEIAGLDRQDYRHDAAGRTGLARSDLGGGARLHRHDAQGRLTEAADIPAPPPLSPGVTAADHAADLAAAQAAPPSARATYAYDRADRRTQTTEGSPLAYARGAAGALVSAGGEALAHGPEGHRSRDGQARYLFDALGRLVQIAGPTGQIDLSYDALGRLTVERRGSSDRRLVHFGGTQVEEHRTGRLHRQATPGPGGLPLAIHQAGGSLIPIYDLRLNRVGLTDEAGRLLERCAYAPFGRAQVMAPDGSPRAASAHDLPPVFGGLVAVPGHDLYLSRGRPMDPRHGVFLSPDPAGTADSPDLYAYARQNPADLADPDGALGITASLLVIAGVGAGLGMLFNGARQGIAIAAGEQPKGFSVWELLTAAGMGAVFTPLLVFAPELAIPMATWGAFNGFHAMGHGQPTAGLFDVLLSTVPFMSPSVAAAAIPRWPGLAALGTRSFWSGTIRSRTSDVQLVGNNPWLMIPSPMLRNKIGMAFSRHRRKGNHEDQGHAGAILDDGTTRTFVDKNPDINNEFRESAYFNGTPQRQIDPSLGLRDLSEIIAQSPPPKQYRKWDDYLSADVPVTPWQLNAARAHAEGRMTLGGDVIYDVNNTAKIQRIQQRHQEVFDFDSATGPGSHNQGNCAHFTLDVLRAGGIRLGLSATDLNGVRAAGTLYRAMQRLGRAHTAGQKGVLFGTLFGAASAPHSSLKGKAKGKS